MLRLSIALAVAALALAALGFSPIPAAVTGVAKLLCFTLALLALISLVAHQSFGREERSEEPSEGRGEEPRRPGRRSPLDR